MRPMFVGRNKIQFNRTFHDESSVGIGRSEFVGCVTGIYSSISEGHIPATKREIGLQNLNSISTVLRQYISMENVQIDKQQARMIGTNF